MADVLAETPTVEENSIVDVIVENNIITDASVVLGLQSGELKTDDKIVMDSVTERSRYEMLCGTETPSEVEGPVEDVEEVVVEESAE